MSQTMKKYKEADMARKEEGGMSRGVGVSVTLLVLLSVAFLCSSVALYIVKENELEKRITLEKQLADVKQEAKKVAADFEELKEVKTRIELELAVKEKEIQNYQEKFALIEAERSALENEKVTLVSKAIDIQQDLLVMGEEFDQLRMAKEVLEQKLKGMLDSSVKLKTIIVEPEPAEEEKEALIEETVAGEVLAVNKEYEFLVINLGRINGLDTDSGVSIYRSSELIAIAKIEKLYENISAIVIDDKRQLERVKVGDAVVATLGQSIGDGNI